MERHCSNAQKIAEFLEQDDRVAWVNYPGLESSPYHELVVVHYFFKFQCVAGQYGNILHHDCTCVFATSTVDSKQQSFCQITACTEELDLLAYLLVRYTAGDSVVVRLTYFTHQIIIFVLNRRSVDGYFSTELFESFRQFGTPQYGQVWFW